MLNDNINKFTFLNIEDSIDFTVEHNCKLLGRNLSKKTQKNEQGTLTLEYEDNLYVIKAYYSNQGRYYTASATRKDINYTEGLPYHRKFKGEIYQKKWHEKETDCIANLTRIIYSIMSIDEKAQMLGIVSKTQSDYGFIQTYNCNYVIFNFSEIPFRLRQMIQPGSILRFRQSTQRIKLDGSEYIKAIDFDNYIKHNAEIPLDELPGCVSKAEERDLIIKNTQTQFNGTQIIAPVLYAYLLEYTRNTEYSGKNYIGKWDYNNDLLYLIDKNTQLIKLMAKRKKGFIYEYEWFSVCPRHPFKNITESDISFFKDMKKYLEKRGINVDKQVLY